MPKHQIILTSIFLFLVHVCVSQDYDDIAFFNTEMKVEKTDYSTHSPIKQDKNELQLLGYIVYQVYHNLVSSQDGAVCNFYPTCSAYCRHAIRKNGFLKGGMQSLDRVIRCNGLSPEKYEVDIKRLKFIDHVQ